jgi:NAD-dependent dihydropyrimidine dehydrogenase PreA subunit
MSKEIDKKCLYDYESKLPPCVILRVYKFSYLSDFITDNKSKLNDLAVALKIECIEFKGNHIDIRNENCINCMFCVFGCPGNNIEIRNDFSLKAMCSNFTLDYDDKLGSSILDKLFFGEFIELPKIRLQQFKVKYKSFEDFTSKDETTNIAVWGANTLKYLSKSNNPRIGLEVGMKISSRDRGGRLDICMLNENLLFVAEAKISFDKMMNEGRFEAQLIAYEEELKATTTDTNISYYKFLLIGGPESDLLPYSHKDCTSKVGNRATLFYDTVIKNDFFFISSNALLSLSLLKLFKGDMYSIENIYKEIFKDGIIGLLSSGLVFYDGVKLEIIPLAYFKQIQLKYKENDDSNLNIAAEP